MNSVQGERRLDSLKWLVVVALVAAGVAGNSYFSGESLLYRVLALVVLAVIAGFVAVHHFLSSVRCRSMGNGISK